MDRGALIQRQRQNQECHPSGDYASKIQNLGRRDLHLRNVIALSFDNSTTSQFT